LATTVPRALATTVADLPSTDPAPALGTVVANTTSTLIGRDLTDAQLNAATDAGAEWSVVSLVHSTPNRLLYSLVRPQGLFLPSLLTVQSTREIVTLTMVLTKSPTAPVTVTMAVPLGWDGKPLITVIPATFTLPAGAANSTPPEINLQLVAGSVSAGTFFVTAQLASVDTFFDSTSQAFRVTDTRPQTGDTIQDPRVVGSLPFLSSGNSKLFSASYGFEVGTGSGGGTNPGTLMPAGVGDGPDVVYKYSWTGLRPQSVTISTCGSTYDTILALTSVGQRLFQTNDDDDGCASNPSNSRIDATLVPGAVYFIVIQGFSGSAGAFKLSITASTATA